MVETYARHAFDQVYLFEPRDRVFVKWRRSGKLLPHSVGPYVFLHYLGMLGKSAEVEGPGGHVI